MLSNCVGGKYGIPTVVRARVEQRNASLRLRDATVMSSCAFVFCKGVSWEGWVRTGGSSESNVGWIASWLRLGVTVIFGSLLRFKLFKLEVQGIIDHRSSPPQCCWHARQVSGRTTMGVQPMRHRPSPGCDPHCLNTVKNEQDGFVHFGPFVFLDLPTRIYHLVRSFHNYPGNLKSSPQIPVNGFFI